MLNKKDPAFRVFRSRIFFERRPDLSGRDLMEKKNSRRTAQTPEQRLYVTMMIMVAFVLLCGLGITLALDIRRNRQELDGMISDSAAYIADQENVKKMLQSGYPDQETIASLDSFVDSFGQIDAVLIANRNGLRFYQTNRLTVGDVYTNGDENFTKYDIYNNGIKKVATIKTINAKYSFCLTMNSVDTGLDMYSVTYVTFTFDCETFTSISDEIAYCHVLA